MGQVFPTGEGPELQKRLSKLDVFSVGAGGLRDRFALRILPAVAVLAGTGTRQEASTQDQQGCAGPADENRRSKFVPERDKR